MIPDISYSKPITVLKADTYKGGAWRSDTDFAVQINAGNQLIIFDSCVFVGGAECIVKAWGGTRIRFIKCGFYGSDPVDQWARYFNGYNVMQFEMINCYMDRTGGGLIERWAGDLNSPLIFQYNQLRNIDNRKKDGSNGNSKHSGLMIKDTSIAGGLTNVDIGWNETINKFGESLVEDNYNLFNAKGTPDKPINFHHNLVWGALPATTDDAGYTGTGFTTDSGGGSNTFDSVTSYVNGSNNVFLDCQNSAINYAIGHDLHIDDTNIILNSGVAPDGTKFKKAWAGCAIFDSNLTAQGANVNDPIFGNNTIKGNTIGSMSWGQNYPFKDRQDEMDDRGTGQWQNRMPRGGNTYLPDGSVTPAAVAAQYDIWQKKFGSAVGINGGVIIVPSVTTSDITLKLTQTASGTLSPTNAAGLAVPFKKADITVKSSDATIFTSSVTDTGVSIKPVKAGKGTLTVSLKTLGGKTITKTKTVEVLIADSTVDNEAVDFSIVFNIT